MHLLFGGNCYIPSLHQDQIFHVSALAHTLSQTKLHPVYTFMRTNYVVIMKVFTCCNIQLIPLAKVSKQPSKVQYIYTKKHTPKQGTKEGMKHKIKTSASKPRPNIFGISSWGIPLPLSYKSYNAHSVATSTIYNPEIPYIQ